MKRSPIGRLESMGGDILAGSGIHPNRKAFYESNWLDTLRLSSTPKIHCPPRVT